MVFGKYLVCFGCGRALERGTLEEISAVQFSEEQRDKILGAFCAKTASWATIIKIYGKKLFSPSEISYKKESSDGSKFVETEL